MVADPHTGRILAKSRTNLIGSPTRSPTDVPAGPAYALLVRPVCAGILALDRRCGGTGSHKQGHGQCKRYFHQDSLAVVGRKVTGNTFDRSALERIWGVWPDPTERRAAWVAPRFPTWGRHSLYSLYIYYTNNTWHAIKPAATGRSIARNGGISPRNLARLWQQQEAERIPDVAAAPSLRCHATQRVRMALNVSKSTGAEVCS